jgi:mono/diheme cytochrome c family protein
MVALGRAQVPGSDFHPIIPKSWDDEQIASLEVPLANPVDSPKHVSADYYYRIPVRTIYRQYPAYPPGHGPEGYISWLRQQEPEIVWGEDKNGKRYAPPLKTEADWIKAGEIVFDSVLGSFPLPDKDLETLGEAASKRGIPLAKDGNLPFIAFRIIQKGRIEIGGGSCASCHTRLMQDGSLLKGAQGNIPFDRIFAEDLRVGLRGPIEAARYLERSLYAPLFQRPDPLDRLQEMSIQELASIHEGIPPGVIARHRASPFYPAQVPDLIGVKDRKYLDHTGLQLHRSIADLMRYAALNQGIDFLASFNGFIPMGGPQHNKLPEPDAVPQIQRYSDEQLYALALFVYSLRPPPNPNHFDAAARRGQAVFQREGCAGCHTPPLYTNNALLPAPGFTVPADHPNRYKILQVSIGTDPNLTMNTRRGTGYYKTPSLKGVWYRGMFEHSGSVATLEDWFDPRRIRNDYAPTGFKGYGVKTRPVPGHQFGLDLSVEDKRALLAFLRTL